MSTEKYVCSVCVSLYSDHTFVQVILTEKSMYMGECVCNTVYVCVHVCACMYLCVSLCVCCV